MAHESLGFLLLQVAIRALGFEVKKADVLKILKDYDKEGKGKITFQDFNEISKSINDRLFCTPTVTVNRECWQIAHLDQTLFMNLLSRQISLLNLIL